MREARTPVLTFTLLLMLSVIATPAKPQDSGSLVGTITGADRTPLHHARVRLLGTLLETETNSDGTFRIAGIPAGSYSLELRLLGFAARMLPVDIVAGATLDVPLTLASAPVPLDTVRVTAGAAASRQLQGFEERRARGVGRFFTREDLARMQPRALTDVLRRVPGFQLQPVKGTSTDGFAVHTGRSGSIGARTCPVLYYVNGSPFPVPADGTINGFIDAEAVVAIEVYNGASQIPPQFNSAMYNARCGVVVIWTRNGSDSSSR